MKQETFNQHERDIRRWRLQILSKIKGEREFDEKELKNPELWMDRNFSLEVVKSAPLYLGYAPESLRDDYEVVAAACLAYPGVIEDASNRIKKDEGYLVRLAKVIDFSKFKNFGGGINGGCELFFITAGFGQFEAEKFRKAVFQEKNELI
jgi:hypothetical protein